MKRLFAFIAIVALPMSSIVVPLPAKANDCSYSLSNYRGRSVPMDSKVEMELSDESPSGRQKGGHFVIMTVDFSLDEDCEDATIDSFGFRIQAKENSNGWLEDMMEYDILALDDHGVDVADVSKSFYTYANGEKTGINMILSIDDLVIEAGETQRIRFVMTTTSRSFHGNDQLTPSILKNSLSWHDDGGRIYRYKHSAITGDTLTYWN